MMNVLLSFLGAACTVAGVALLVALVWSSWGYAGILEFVLGALLLGCTAFGLGLLAAVHPSFRTRLRRAWTRAMVRAHGAAGRARVAGDDEAAVDPSPASRR